MPQGAFRARGLGRSARTRLNRHVVLCVRGSQALQGKFPSSSRVARLEGMQLVRAALLSTAVTMTLLNCAGAGVCAWQEQRGEFAKAEALYNELLEANPANNLVAKRKIAVLKAQKRTHDVIAALNEFLRSFGTDQAAVRPDVWSLHGSRRSSHLALAGDYGSGLSWANCTWRKAPTATRRSAMRSWCC